MMKISALVSAVKQTLVAKAVQVMAPAQMTPRFAGQHTSTQVRGAKRALNRTIGHRQEKRLRMAARRQADQRFFAFGSCP